MNTPIHGTPEQVLAFCKAYRKMQPEIPAFPRTREGQEGNRKFHYTEYDKVLEIVEPIFEKHGFFHFQRRSTVETESGPMAAVDSFLIHELGAFSHAHNEARVEAKNAIRESGKAHTYFSRYGLIGLIGKTSETDQDAPESPQQQPQRARQAAPKPQSAPQTKPPDDRCKEAMEALIGLIRGRAKDPAQEKDFMSRVAAYSVDAWGEKPSVLASRGDGHKLAEVLRWADENLGAIVDVIDDGGYEDVG